MKRILALVLSVLMVFAFVGCGKTEEAKAAVSYELTGTVVGFTGDDLIIETDDGIPITFNVSDSLIILYGDGETVEVDDTAIVAYEEEIGENGDASNCKVTTVTVMPGDEKTVEGTIYSIGDSEGTITVKTADGAFLTFDITTAERHYRNGIQKGNEVVVKYTGTIDGNDTSKAHVHVVIDEAENKAKEIEQVTVTACDDTVYTTAAVNIRAGSSSATESLAVAKKGVKFKRTAKLSDGWSRIVYNGQDAYIATQYLTTKAPKKPSTTKKTTKATTKPTNTKKTTEKPTTKPTKKPTKPTTEPTKPTKPTKKPTKPTQPTSDDPTEPTSDDPTEPSSDDPTEPSSDDPTEPSSDDPTEPSSDDPTEPSSDEPTETTEETTEETQGDDEIMSRLSGTIVSASTSSMTIKTSDGRELTFDTSGAAIDITGGEMEGHSVTVEYTGKINGTDTSGAKNLHIYG